MKDVRNIRKAFLKMQYLSAACQPGKKVKRQFFERGSRNKILTLLIFKSCSPAV